MSSGSRRVSGELVRAYAPSDVDAEAEWVAETRSARALLMEVGLVAPTSRTVLVCGETGTGKTHVARLIHAHSAPELPLQVINCAALPETLLAETLWHLYDDAADDLPRRTVLLDEVGELSPWSQAVLLHKLQIEERRISGPRFIAATHRDLPAMAASGAFSRELLVRLSAARLTLTPLRQRRDEIQSLALHFLRLALRAAGIRLISVEDGMLQCLERHDWPGNARELRNAMLRVLAVNESGTLELSDLPDSVRLGAPAAASSASNG